MGTGEELDRTAVRKRLKPEVSGVVLEAMDQGWRVKALGHGVKLFCPCVQPDHGTFSVSGTPKSPTNEARRVRKMLSRCPKFGS
ncbi:hypothetical protein MLP_28810 [Microlunatus phosphovorus NM-1]|uniref:Uncharacterized protein n=1 Tax=Microlunatus phosphovorus (strain ATCC 700054 / DSM 10555 / JCM 9379 / NBRC 101784 / NCIMB 13414 / VKM Ac-1990 / NM-1) TaxID=1032480 RepID=F5XJJ5_MICPN|nr:hypothetical protein [Microlunatus phosphovorus]BAK35895.1 hypothetical protein MLP_28810 [Microlunatus phosphovorus NM-1]